MTPPRFDIGVTIAALALTVAGTAAVFAGQAPAGQPPQAAQAPGRGQAPAGQPPAGPAGGGAGQGRGRGNAPPTTTTTAPAPAAARGGATQELRVLEVRPNVHMISGAGANITVLTFTEGVLLVDTGTAQMSRAVLDAIRKLSDRPVAHIINTSASPDHVGGNEAIAATGRRIPAEIVAGEGPMILAHENVLNRMSAPTGRQAAAPEKAWPNNTYHDPTKKLSTHFHGGEAIELFFQPAAYSDGDSIVWFRHADVIVTGEIYSTTTYPVIDVASGGTIDGVIDGLNKILDVAFPDFRSEGGTMIIPARGRLSDMADVAYYRDMVTIIRARVQDLIKKKQTLEQVKAAKVTRDYDPRFGATSGPWTTDMFVDAVYKTLSAKK